ncbi:DsbA family protein [Rhodobacter sp. NTK016B]|uniref:DsbA family protein n=1 Tax=Rhodobacter sp. NTK016B TaxID=2759676 RepID=UPI001A8C0B55|nr:DsbA family protein [Rhodobacter sp. NTK016B]MBN8293532.1 DsbA family protein [Rhodobacter sp. NTK016B]
MPLRNPHRRAFLAQASALGVLGMATPRALFAQETADLVRFDPDAPVLGNPDGDVTLVEYFDYQCGFCKAMHPLITDLVARDGNTRLVLKDWPVFGVASVYAAQLALGAASLGQYAEVNHALMETRGELAFDVIADIVGSVVSPDEAMAAYDENRARWDPLLARNAAQAETFGFYGTPSFVIGSAQFHGAMDLPELEAAIADARA